MQGFTSPRPCLDEDIKMAPIAMQFKEPLMPHTLQNASSQFPSSSQAGYNTAAPSLVIAPDRPENQIVLHRSRCRRASGELTSDLEKDASTSTSGGWRPVRLQGYSEDPMKDEIIRSQTEIIKELQSKVKNLQEEHARAIAADHRAREAVDALQREQAKASQQEDLLEQLQAELQNLRADAPPYSKGKAKEIIWQQIKSSEGLEEIDALSLSSSSYIAEGSPMLLEQDRRGKTDLRNKSRTIIQGRVRDLSPETTEWQPRSISVPLPLSFKKAEGRRGQRRKIPSTPPPVHPTTPLTWDDTTTSAPLDNMPQTNPVADLEAKVDLIIKSLGIGNGSSPLPYQQRDRRLPAREFRSPRPKIQKENGRNERLAWVRSQLHDLLGIKQDRDILNARNSLYGENTPIKHQMALYEKDARSPGPVTLKPMQVNWDTIHCKWNESLLGLFLGHCQENGYAGGRLTDEDEDEIGEIFFKRLEHIQGIINEYRPKADETIEQADKRYSDKHLIKLSVARRNRRRGELFNSRCDINLDHLPDDLESIGQPDEKTKRWIDCYKINEAFGIEGTSSDETDPYESDAYYVHTLRWRNRDLAKKMRSTDAARRTTNEYGNNRPGNRPRIRKRRAGSESQESVRKIPSDLPINCYDESWYNSLSAKRKRELCAKPALQLLASWESD